MAKEFKLTANIIFDLYRCLDKKGRDILEAVIPGFFEKMWENITDKCEVEFCIGLRGVKNFIVITYRPSMGRISQIIYNSTWGNTTAPTTFHPNHTRNDVRIKWDGNYIEIYKLKEKYE